MVSAWLALALAAPCEGERVEVDGRERVLVRTSGMGQGRSATGEIAVTLADPATCEGPRLVVHLGGGHSDHSAELVGHPSEAERARLMAAQGYVAWEPSDLLGGPRPSTERLPLRIPQQVTRSESPAWVEGEPRAPRTTWRPVDCAERLLEGEACWVVLDAEAITLEATHPVSPAVDLLLYANSFRNKQVFHVLRDKARGRSALVHVELTGGELPTPIDGPGGMWLKRSVFMDPGHVLTRVDADGTVFRIELPGVWVKTLDAQGLHGNDESRPFDLPWSLASVPIPAEARQ